MLVDFAPITCACSEMHIEIPANRRYRISFNPKGAPAPHISPEMDKKDTVQFIADQGVETIRTVMKDDFRKVTKLEKDTLFDAVKALLGRTGIVPVLVTLIA